MNTCEGLYGELKELETSVEKLDLPLIALDIAGSRIDMAFISQEDTDHKKARRDLDMAKRIYDLHGKGEGIKIIGLVNEMKTRLGLDHPQHYLLD